VPGDDLGVVVVAFPYSSFAVNLTVLGSFTETIERLVGRITHTVSKTGKIVRRPRLIEDVLKKRSDVLSLAIYPPGEQPDSCVGNQIATCSLYPNAFTLCVRAGVVYNRDELVAPVQVLASEVVYGYIRTGGIRDDLVWGDLGVCKGMAVEERRNSDANRWAVVIRKPPVRKLRSVYATNFFRERYFQFEGGYLEDWILNKGIGQLSEHGGSGLLTWKCDESERAIASVELADLLMAPIV